MITTVTTATPLVYLVGKCIYCGSTEHLTREHVIPFGLGGGLILLSASCHKCSDITKRFEDDILRKAFGLFRAKSEFPTRRRRERPDSAKAVFGSGTGQEEERDLPLTDIPNHFHLPIFSGPPGILNEETPRRVEIVNFMEVRKRDGTVERAVAEHGKFSVDTYFHQDQFVRLLAKIAHGFTYVNFDTTNMRPLLLDVINGDFSTNGYLVGMSDKNLDSCPGINIKNNYFQFDQNRAVIFALIRLFAIGATPTYSVAVGEFAGMPEPTCGAHLRRVS